jgi:hypothetical protein
MVALPSAASGVSSTGGEGQEEEVAAAIVAAAAVTRGWQTGAVQELQPLYIPRSP